jgi:putative selenate reductase
MDKKDRAYGTVEHVIPEFRISSEMIQKDIELVKAQGVNFKFGIDGNINVDKLKKDYDYVVLAIGAWKPGQIKLEEGSEKTLNAIAFLEDYKIKKGDVSLGKHVCIIGGGNVAMDAARAAKRVPGVESVSIVYRRTKKYMPADHEEIELAASEGIAFRELLSPKTIRDGKLVCDEMKLGDRDSSGRRSPVPSGNTVQLNADAVIVAVGEQIDKDILLSNGIELDAKGFPKVGATCETNIANVYVAGDVRKGPATIVKGIADGKAVAKDILAKESLAADFVKMPVALDENILYSRKGLLKEPSYVEKEAGRCLNCDTICELCVDVCPNRANALIIVDGDFESTHQIIHFDGMCNECGNCGVFCPNTGNPYKDKITVFWSEEDFEDSTNRGFVVLNREKGLCKVRTEDGSVVNYKIGQDGIVSKQMAAMIKSCVDKYSYML